MKDLNKFKILLFACLLFICAISLGQSGPTPLIQVDADQIIDGAVSAIKVDGSIALTANVYDKQEVDSKLGSLASDLAAGNRLFYCGPDTEVIDGVTYGVYADENPPAVSTIAIGPIVGTTYAQYSPGRGRVSHELGITSIPAGVYERVSHMANSDSAGRDVTVVYELWRVDSAGTKISLIATSSEKIISALGTSVVQRVENEFVIASAVTLDPTDRLLEEFFFKRSGVTTGTSPTITRYIGGNRAGFLSLALPSAVVMRTDGSNSAKAVTLKDLELTGNLTGVNASFTGAVEAGGLAITPRSLTGLHFGGASIAANTVASVTYFLPAGATAISSRGKLTVVRCSGDGGYADYYLSGSSATIVSSNDTTTNWGTSAGSKLFNVYHNGTDFVFQNNTANVGIFSVMFIGSVTRE